MACQNKYCDDWEAVEQPEARRRDHKPATLFPQNRMGRMSRLCRRQRTHAGRPKYKKPSNLRSSDEKHSCSPETKKGDLTEETSGPFALAFDVDRLTSPATLATCRPKMATVFNSSNSVANVVHVNSWTWIKRTIFLVKRRRLFVASLSNCDCTMYPRYKIYLFHELGTLQEALDHADRPTYLVSHLYQAEFKLDH